MGDAVELTLLYDGDLLAIDVDEIHGVYRYWWAVCAWVTDKDGKDHFLRSERCYGVLPEAKERQLPLGLGPQWAEPLNKLEELRLKWPQGPVLLWFDGEERTCWATKDGPKWYLLLPSLTYAPWSDKDHRHGWEELMDVRLLEPGDGHEPDWRKLHAKRIG